MLRERLLAQVAAIESSDAAVAWAYRALSAKNTLTEADAQVIEQQFQQRLSSIANEGRQESPKVAPGQNARRTIKDDEEARSNQTAMPHKSTSGEAGRANRRARIVVKKAPSKPSVGALGKTVRLRDKEHRKFVSRQACIVCGRAPADAHHLTFTQPRALGRRVSDEFTVPVCRIHHRELHRSADEAGWWKRLEIDPLQTATKLWQQTRPAAELDESSTHGISEAASKKLVS